MSYLVVNALSLHPASTRHKRLSNPSYLDSTLIRESFQEILTSRKKRIDTTIGKSSLNLNFSSEIVIDLPQRKRRYNSDIHLEIIRDKSCKQRAMVDRLIQYRSQSSSIIPQNSVNNSMLSSSKILKPIQDQKKSQKFVRLPYIRRP